MTTGDLLDRLAAGAPVDEPVVLVAAHPDDETIGMGGRLDRFADLTLIHVTDGAPLDLADARKAGFATREAYARARAAELDAALAALGARPRRRIACGIGDQGAVEQLDGLAARLVADLAGATAVFTHAYEGGHPDHDACALAVQLACGRLGRSAPLRLEFAGYHAEDGRMAAQRFWSDPNAPEAEAALSPADRARKRAAFAAHATQAEMLATFSPDVERYRIAPRYDFSRPPAPGAWLYDGFGFELTGAAWLAKARRFLHELAAEAA